MATYIKLNEPKFKSILVNITKIKQVIKNRKMKKELKKSNSYFEFQFNNKCNMLPNSKHSQISFEYLIIMGFVTFVIIGVLGIAMFYSEGIKDRIKITQMTNCANKIISTAESVFYSGYPSRATITCQLPENIQEISIAENSLVMSLQTSSGLMKTAFTSNVPISEGAYMITSSPGVKKIKLEARDDSVTISKG